MSRPSVEELLKKNPDARDIFEQNARKLGKRRQHKRRGTGYDLALPYGRPRSNQDGWAQEQERPVASYQRW